MDVKNANRDQLVRLVDALMSSLAENSNLVYKFLDDLDEDRQGVLKAAEERVEDILSEIGEKEEPDTVELDLDTYEQLLRSDELLMWLESSGVDNWQGYSTPPDREDYDSDEEYQEEYERLLYGW